MTSLVGGNYSSVVRESWRSLVTVWNHQLVFLKMAVIPLIVLSLTNLSDFIPESQFRFVIDSSYLHLSIQEAIRYFFLTIFGGLLIPSYLTFILTGKKPENAYIPSKQSLGKIFKMVAWLVPLVTIGTTIFLIVYFSLLLLLPLLTYDKSFFSGNFVFMTAVGVAIASSVILAGLFALICPAIANNEPAGPMLFFRSLRRLWGYFFKALFTLILVTVAVLFFIYIADAAWTAAFSFLDQPVFEKVSKVAGIFIWGYTIAYYLACLSWIQARYYSLALKKEQAAH